LEKFFVCSLITKTFLVATKFQSTKSFSFLLESKTFHFRQNPKDFIFVGIQNMKSSLSRHESRDFVDHDPITNKPLIKALTVYLRDNHGQSIGYNLITLLQWLDDCPVPFTEQETRICLCEENIRSLLNRSLSISGFYKVKKELEDMKRMTEKNSREPILIIDDDSVRRFEFELRLMSLPAVTKQNDFYYDDDEDMGQTNTIEEMLFDLRSHILLGYPDYDNID
jgi:hypothetical protein